MPLRYITYFLIFTILLILKDDEIFNKTLKWSRFGSGVAKNTLVLLYWTHMSSNFFFTGYSVCGFCLGDNYGNENCWVKLHRQIGANLNGSWSRCLIGCCLEIELNRFVRFCSVLFRYVACVDL